MSQYPGVDAEGFIQSLPDQPLQPVFSPLVDELCAILSRRFPALLDGLYLYGSVARGDARPGTSDLDVTLVLAWAPSPEERQRLEETRQALEARHPEVSKIDFDIGVLSEVLAPDNRYRWGFWLKHQCRCIWGNDLGLRFEPFRPSRTIALALNGDFPQVLEGYAQQLEQSREPLQQQRLQRAAARKALRSANLLRGELERGWPTTLEEHAQLLSAAEPGMAEYAAFFLKQAYVPQGSVNEFVQRLRAYSALLAGESAQA
ncbi:putative nucleotidyltransferase [Pseudomonas chlororaphis subsp. aurantiaca]|uniref:nucleotidyltransferase domain-containing protein n=1 Tax=Pseudomonas chlororaphis TaxID=587753 RepID=UPI000F57F6D0|nr:nucleotidyltransferase domain-containing protein [Pseudomonas chlororaphis]AZD23373.1 putative nucleotidyltransferase [Pseudomonas chlororaphis subsp. aurantiaca]